MRTLSGAITLFEEGMVNTMLSTRLFQDIDYTGSLPEVEITAVTNDSRRVQPGSVFVCTAGRTFDGHRYAQKALDAGAALVVTERPLGLAAEVTVANGRKAYAQLCSAFFDHPCRKLRLVAVTGTNGKTTVTTVIKQILDAAGHRCGLIGTIHTLVDTMELPAKYTTPEAWDLHMLLAKMAGAGCDCAVMEASSQALDQLRLFGLRFECGVFTNLTQDHLDYHGDMETYFQAKASLFRACDTVIYNADDTWARRLPEMYPEKRCIGFSAGDNAADFTARSIALDPGGVRFALVDDRAVRHIRFPMPGAFSVYNAMAAGLVALRMGVTGDALARALAESRGVRGRSEVLYHGDFTVICDFAHTPDSIEKILAGMRPFAQNRLLALFGCAGERDATKRPAMVDAALKYADFLILTSDNPRKEDPQSILDSIEPLVKAGGKPYLVEMERRRAVYAALAQLQKGDVLVLCGKGHEDYQVIDGVTIYLDEHRIVRDWLRENGLQP